MRSKILPLLLLLAACSGEKQPEVKLSEALPNIIAPPNAQILSRESGADAIKIRFRSELSPEAVAAFYRSELTRAPYTLVSDVKSDSGVALYAENPEKPSLWVWIGSDGAKGSFVDIAGARERPKRQ
ncbi:MAG TPA: hypothetical protein VG817_00115 [Gemmatimonadales bacterium]|nr:hypothetical protein [Gemmatimonadales bacterium]